MGEKIPTKFANRGAYNTEDTSYDVLRHLFKRVAPKPDDVIVDVGCGRGRVINYLLSRGLKNRIIGLELDPDVAADTAGRLAGYDNVIIVNGDAIENLPPQGTLFYLYNPFAEFMVRRLNAKLLRLPTAEKVRVIYYNCLHVDPFRNDPAWWVEMHHVPGRRDAALISPAANLISDRGKTMGDGTKVTLRPVQDDDGPGVVAILNHYIKNSYAAYPEKEHPREVFGVLAKMVLPGSFNLVEIDEEVAGFAFLTPFLHAPTLARTAQVTYFIAPGYTSRGLGVVLLDKLTEVARGAGVDNLLAHISTLNDGSIRFHQKNGFEICGEFKNVGRKNGQDFGVVYMQKFIKI